MLLCLVGIILTGGVVDEESPVVSANAVKITISDLGQKFYFTTKNKGYVIFDLKEKYSGTFTVEFKYRISPVAPVFKPGYSSPKFFVGDATYLHQDFDNYYKSLDNNTSNSDKKTTVIKTNNMTVIVNNNFSGGSSKPATGAAANSSPLLYKLRDLSFCPVLRGCEDLMPQMPPPPPPVKIIFHDESSGSFGCNNYYKIHNCKWIIDFTGMTTCCAVDGYHSITKYPIVGKDREYCCFGVINSDGEAGNAIEISDVKIQHGVPPGDAKHDVEYPRKQFREYEKMASLKDPESMYWLGLCYYEGSFGAPKACCAGSVHFISIFIDYIY